VLAMQLLLLYCSCSSRTALCCTGAWVGHRTPSSRSHCHFLTPHLLARATVVAAPAVMLMVGHSTTAERWGGVLISQFEWFTKVILSHARVRKTAGGCGHPA
jgi:hypothetical protein